MLDASLQVLAQAPAAIGRRGAYQAYFGSGEHAVRLRVLGARAIEPGTTGAVRLHLPAALPLLPGDRFVLRDSGRSTTVGGGEVLDVAPVLPAASAGPDRSVDRVIAERGWVEVPDLLRLTGVRRPPSLGDRWVVDPSLLAATRRELLSSLTAAAPRGVELTSLGDRDREVLAAMARDGEVVLRNGWARLEDDEAALASHPYVEALDRSLFNPPDPSDLGVDRADLRQLVSTGLVVERDGRYFSARALDRGTQLVAELLAGHPEGVTVSMVRDRLKTSRRHAVPFLSLLDARGLTRRKGDVRVAGPRLGVAQPATSATPGDDQQGVAR